MKNLGGTSKLKILTELSNEHALPDHHEPSNICLETIITTDVRMANIVTSPLADHMDKEKKLPHLIYRLRDGVRQVLQWQKSPQQEIVQVAVAETIEVVPASR